MTTRLLLVCALFLAPMTAYSHSAQEGDTAPSKPTETVTARLRSLVTRAQESGWLTKRTIALTALGALAVGQLISNERKLRESDDEQKRALAKKEEDHQVVIKELQEKLKEQGADLLSRSIDGDFNDSMSEHLLTDDGPVWFEQRLNSMLSCYKHRFENHKTPKTTIDIEAEITAKLSSDKTKIHFVFSGGGSGNTVGYYWQVGGEKKRVSVPINDINTFLKLSAFFKKEVGRYYLELVKKEKPEGA